MQTVLKHNTEGVDHLNIFQSRLINAMVPQVPNYPEIVEWCAQGYLPEEKVVMSRDTSRVVISITPEAIEYMLSFPQGVASKEWNEDSLQSLYQGQTPEIKQQLILDNLKDKMLIVGPPYPIKSFTATAIMALSMLSQALGLTSALLVTEAHLGALLFLSHPSGDGHDEYIDFCKILSRNINQELQDFHLTRTFRYQANLVHLFLHQQFSFMGHLHLNMVGSDHQVRPTIGWCPKIRNTVENENLQWYINDFLPVLYTLLHDGPLPRVIPEIFQEL